MISNLEKMRWYRQTCLAVYMINLLLIVTVPVNYTGRFIMFSMITNIYNKKTKGPALIELFTTRVKLKKFFF
jgi:hypothetical protein